MLFQCPMQRNLSLESQSIASHEASNAHQEEFDLANLLINVMKRIRKIMNHLLNEMPLYALG